MECRLSYIQKYIPYFLVWLGTLHRSGSRILHAQIDQANSECPMVAFRLFRIGRGESPGNPGEFSPIGLRKPLILLVIFLLDK